MSGPPRIGVTVSSRATEEQRCDYLRPLEEQGAEAVTLLAGQRQAEAEGLDGLVLGGGGDVDPALYGQPSHPRTADVDRARDEFELDLVAQALASGMPILGICRGAQVLGVALGGTLVQDIPTLVPNPCQHAGGRHEVETDLGSRLAGRLGFGRLEVNSFHHQANASLGEGVRAAACSRDGVIEAIEVQGREFVIGVQWHPERMSAEGGQGRLFAALVAAAAARARLSGSRGR